MTLPVLETQIENTGATGPSTTSDARYRVLVSDPISETGLAPLRADPHIAVDLRTDLTPATLLEVIGGYYALLVRSGTQVTGDVLRAGKSLRVVARAGVGVSPPVRLLISGRPECPACRVRPWCQWTNPT